MRIALCAVLIGGLTSAAPSASWGRPEAAFSKLKPGKTRLARVRELLGSPRRAYDVFAEVGETPVHVPYLDPSDTMARGQDNPFTHPGDLKDPQKATHDEGPELEMLYVLQYKVPGSPRPFYVVLRNDVVHYVIGPVGRRESSQEALRKRYGKPDLVYVEEGNYGDFSRSIEVYAYRKKGVAFLRELGRDEFTAKAVGLNLRR